MNAHADMFIVVGPTTNQTHQGAFTALLLWVTKVSSFQSTKTSANKRLFIMSAKSVNS